MNSSSLVIGILMVLQSVYLVVKCHSAYELYIKRRKSLIKHDKKAMLGARLKLTADEEKLDKILMTYKNTYLNKNTSPIDLSKHYIQNRDAIQDSDFYMILKKMPKGGVLHVHDAALHRVSYLLKMTYEFVHLYICFRKSDVLFHHSRKAPLSLNCNWTSVPEARKSDPENFDNVIESYLTMYVAEPELIYLSRDEAVTKLMQVHTTVTSLISNKEAYEQFMEDGLQVLFDDGVMYAEIRVTIPEMTDLDGNDYNYVAMLKALKQKIKRFKTLNPSFVGIKLIYAPTAPQVKTRLKRQMKVADDLRLMWPVNFAGFDQIWHDDPESISLDRLAEQLVDFKMPFYFHAGESQWNGNDEDESLFSALALKARRISPAFGLSKHQVLASRVKKKHIGVVSTVISDQILCLIRDIRNHPLAYYLAINLHVSLSGDYPGFWGASPVTDDFFIMFLAIASEEANIKLLKQLIFNSIKYSALSREKKEKTLMELQKLWLDFVNNVVYKKQSELHRKPVRPH